MTSGEMMWPSSRPIRAPVSQGGQADQQRLAEAADYQEKASSLAPNGCFECVRPEFCGPGRPLVPLRRHDSMANLTRY
jgi:hypothetical protein